MPHYITNSLEEGEKIVFQGHLHWTSVYQYIFSALLLALMAIGLLAAGYYTSRQELYIVSVLFFIIASIIYIIGRLVRTRSEFAVTNNRFIQKDGILNIKMKEMPLFKIETVNFYQSLWQRILGTGCVEMVGSGGTSHQVHCIEQPMKVRKIIVASIKKPQSNQNAQSIQNNPNTQNETAEN